MIAAFFAGSIALLVGLPFGLLPVWPIATAGLAAAVLYVVGAIARSSGATAVAGGVMLLNYAMALWLTSAPIEVAGAIAFGLGLLFASDTASFLRRARDGHVFRTAVAHRMRFYGRQTLATAAAAIILLFGAGPISGALPAGWRPILLGIGAVLGLLGILRGNRARMNLVSR